MSASFNTVYCLNDTVVRPVMYQAAKEVQYWANVTKALPCDLCWIGVNKTHCFGVLVLGVVAVGVN